MNTFFRMMMKSFVFCAGTVVAATAFCQPGLKSPGSISPEHQQVANRLLATGLTDLGAHRLLGDLTARAPHRLSGSEGAATAVALTQRMMTDLGFQNVHAESVMVPHWVRGDEECWVVPGTKKHPQAMRLQSLAVCALGRSVATPPEGIEAEVIEVKNFDQVKALGKKAEGKIIFYNRPFDPAKLNTFDAYGGAVDQRSRGAIEAAKVGAVAVLVRSMTHRIDDVPHTGAMSYADSVTKIPAAAISTQGANELSALLSQGKPVTVRLKLTPQTLPDVLSANVIGEITGSEQPDEIIVVGGHLDCWDKGQGAHDDGAGCVQAIEALALLKHIGVTPKRTIRAVMFMNEENGSRGAKAYPVAPERSGEVHIAAIESDRGGFAPRGLSVQADSAHLAKLERWKPVFKVFRADDIVAGGSGVDIGPLAESGVPSIGLVPEDQRYFDYHHSDNDTIDKVNPRELELGAIVEAMLCFLISEGGL